MRTGPLVPIALLAASVASVPARGQDDRCGAGKDLVVQALERITPQSNKDAFEDALQLLKHAVQECSELGDAAYYRSLVERRLGHDALARTPWTKRASTTLKLCSKASIRWCWPRPPAAALSWRTPELERPSPRPHPRAWLKLQGPSPRSGRSWSVSPASPINRFRASTTTADASSFAAELTDPHIGRFPSSHVHMLTDEQATTKNIKEGLNWIARHAAVNDLVVIYVATHGTPRTLDTAGGANYLVTYDTEVYRGSSPKTPCLPPPIPWSSSPTQSPPA